MEKEITAKETRQFEDLTVTAEFSDTKDGFYYRLVCEDVKTRWSRFYPGFIQLQIGVRFFMVFTGFWASDDVPETDVPLEIRKGQLKK